MAGAHPVMRGLMRGLVEQDDREVPEEALGVVEAMEKAAVGRQLGGEERFPDLLGLVDMDVDEGGEEEGGSLVEEAGRLSII
jgi:hypothetical protein